MKRVLIAAAAVLTLSACATATPYQPASRSDGGFAETRLESNRYRVTFAGNSLTARETVEDYLLYRAAELTVENGFDWFSAVNRDTEADRRYYAQPDPFSRWDPFWTPSWRYYRRGYWTPWSPWDRFGPREIDVREVTRYEATAEIVMGRGQKPQNDPHAFDAREVMQNLGSRVQRPQPR